MEVLTLVLHADAFTGPLVPVDLDKEEIVIGRDQACDVALPDASVSLRHASIRPEGEGYVVIDEGSSNGTFVGDVSLAPNAPRRLADGDFIRIGSVWLEVRTGPVDLAKAPVALPIAANAGAPREDAGSDEPCVHVRIKGGPDRGRALRLEPAKGPFVIGRVGEGCDLSLHDGAVSRRHAQVTWEGTGALVCDLGSKNGTWMQDERLPPGRAVAWAVGIDVRVGTTVLELAPPPAV